MRLKRTVTATQRTDSFIVHNLLSVVLLAAFITRGSEVSGVVAEVVHFFLLFALVLTIRDIWNDEKARKKP